MATAVPPAEENGPARAAEYFRSARAAADRGRYRAAIELYLEGLRRDPDDVEAHRELRQIALRRRAVGGKRAGIFRQIRLRRRTPSPLANLLHAEELLAYDPANIEWMVAAARHAAEARLEETAVWLREECRKATATNGDKPGADHIQPTTGDEGAGR